VVSSSSTRRAARLAQKGKGKRVRFQGGTLFPLVVAIVLVVGMLLVVYSRQSIPEADASPPTVDDHWHAANGYLICDADGWKPPLSGVKEEQGTSGFQEYQATGVHSHDDGVMHWHPFTSRAVGRNAQLGVFHEVYGIELDDDSLRFPDDQGGEEYIEGETKCGEEDAELQVVVWNNFSDTDDGTTYISDFDDIRLTDDGMVFAIAFVPDGVEVLMPPWAPDLPELGAADAGGTEPVTASTTPGTGTSAGTATTPGSGSTPASGSTPGTGTATASTTAGSGASSPATTGAGEPSANTGGSPAPTATG